MLVVEKEPKLMSFLGHCIFHRVVMHEMKSQKKEI